MELTNMALPKPKKGDKNAAGLSVADAGQETKFPWGLRVNLEDAEIKKLGLKLKDFDTDTVVRIEAKAEVTRVSEDDTRSNGKTQSLSFQITDMSLLKEGDDGFERGWDAATKGKPQDKGKDNG